jgi:hypothetical protein
MPINPNIALGAQNQAQPINMLGQMGQLYALKAAKQEFEGGEALRDAFASGGDLNDPAFVQRLRAANPKMALDIEAKHLAGQKTRSELEAAAYKNTREALTMVNNPESLRAFSLSQFNDPVIGPRLKAIGLTPEIALANLDKEIATSGFETALKKASMGLDSFFKDQTSRRNTDVSSGASYGQLELAKKKFELEQAQQANIDKILSGDATAPTAPPAASSAPMGGGGQLGSGTFGIPMGGGAPVTGAITPSAAAPTSVVTKPNVLADQVAPSGTTPAPVNALLNPPAGQTGAAPVANRVDQITTQLTQLSKINNPAANQAMERLIKEYNVLNPEGEIKQNANGALVTVNRRTNVATPVLGKDGKPVMGNLPYETAFATTVGKGQGERNEKVVLAAQAAVDNIAKIDSTIELLKTGDATTGLGAELRNNIDRARALFAGDIKAGKKVADTQILDALLGSDVFSMIQSLGIGARGLDTPAERDYLRQVMTGTIQMDTKALVRLSEIRRNIETRAIEKYNTQLEKGELNKYFETQGIKPEKIEIPKMAGGSNTVSVGGNTYTFPNAEAAAKFKKDAGIK